MEDIFGRRLYRRRGERWRIYLEEDYTGEGGEMEDIFRRRLYRRRGREGGYI